MHNPALRKRSARDFGASPGRPDDYQRHAFLKKAVEMAEQPLRRAAAAEGVARLARLYPRLPRSLFSENWIFDIYGSRV